MNKRSIAALALAAVMTLGVAASSYAWFTSQATSYNNTVNTGTLVIGGPSGNSTLKAFTLSNLYPGAEGSKSENITIRNNGSINLTYNVTSTFKGGDPNLYNIALVKVTNNSGVELYNDNLNKLSKINVNKSLAVAESETLNFTVSLPDNAGDVYQNKTMYVDFVFNAGQTSFVTSPLLGEWTTDRTEPNTWNINNGWVTYSTNTAPANNWYAWQGKKISTDNVLTNNWKVETELKLTDELLSRDGVRTSMWLNVQDQNGKDADWAILQYKIDQTTGVKGWQYFDSTNGTWKDIATDVPVTAGVYKLAISYDNGNVIGYLNGIQAFSYAISGTKATSVKEIIYNSYSFGQTYEVQWKVPTLSYVQNK